MFQTLHLMFMTQYNEAWLAVDLVAERIRALGYPAPGSYKEFAALTSIKDSSGSVSAKEMISSLSPDRKPWCAPHAKYCLSPKRRATSRPSICFPRAWKYMKRTHGCYAVCWKND